MKKSKKFAIASAFCTGMLSLSACTEPESVYGPPPVSVEESSSADSNTDSKKSETQPQEEESSGEYSEFVPPQLVYGPPNSFGEGDSENIAPQTLP